MIDIICVLCGKKQQIEVLYRSTLKEGDISAQTYSARRLPDRLHYRFLKCKRCGLIFSSPIFEQAKIINLYKESSCNYDDQIPFAAKTYLKIFKRVRNLLPEKPNVLEVGCGNGFFLNELRKKGIKDVRGVEPSLEMVSKATEELKPMIKIDIFKKNQFPKNFFDTICCFHTLDHMIDPSEFVSESFRLLKKNGIAIVVVHDTDGLSVKLFGERSPIFDIEHIYLFNKQNLKKIFLRRGFEVVDVFNLVNTYPLSYWVKMSGTSLVFKKIIQKTLSMLNLSNMNLSLAGGNICIIAKKLV